jgi:hypothetical protein
MGVRGKDCRLKRMGTATYPDQSLNRRDGILSQIEKQVFEEQMPPENIWT